MTYGVPQLTFCFSSGDRQVRETQRQVVCNKKELTGQSCGYTGVGKKELTGQSYGYTGVGKKELTGQSCGYTGVGKTKLTGQPCDPTDDFVASHLDNLHDVFYIVPNVLANDLDKGGQSREEITAVVVIAAPHHLPMHTKRL